MSNQDIAAELWHRAYPDRRPFDKIGTEAQDEWRRLVVICRQLLREENASPAAKKRIRRTGTAQMP